MLHHISVAPMMDWTDRHCRYFHRLLSPNVLLYTEMITTGALLHGDAQRFLLHDLAEYPLAIQLGGSEPAELARCAVLAEKAGYHEVNLNVGCPSDRVQHGRFGACLMAEPKRIADCVAAMKSVVSIPVTVKTRIGIDDQEDYAFLKTFVTTVAAQGCDTFIIHARKAWLSGLNPKQNRTIPPLRYEVVEQLKKEFPQLFIILNGGITTLESVEKQLQIFDGVMIGREAYQNPYFLAQIEQRFFSGENTLVDPHSVIEKYLSYISMQLKNGVPLNQMTRHILNFFQAVPGARRWRRYLSEHAHKKGAGVEVVQNALACLF